MYSLRCGNLAWPTPWLFEQFKVYSYLKFMLFYERPCFSSMWVWADHIGWASLSWGNIQLLRHFQTYQMLPTPVGYASRSLWSMGPAKEKTMGKKWGKINTFTFINKFGEKSGFGETYLHSSFSQIKRTKFVEHCCLRLRNRQPNWLNHRNYYNWLHMTFKPLCWLYTKCRKSERWVASLVFLFNLVEWSHVF